MVFMPGPLTSFDATAPGAVDIAVPEACDEPHPANENATNTIRPITRMMRRTGRFEQVTTSLLHWMSFQDGRASAVQEQRLSDISR
jgi:hypothetical protein